MTNETFPGSDLYKLYTAATARIDALMDAKLGTPEGEELDMLARLIEFYDAKLGH